MRMGRRLQVLGVRRGCQIFHQVGCSRGKAHSRGRVGVLRWKPSGKLTHPRSAHGTQTGCYSVRHGRCGSVTHGWAIRQLPGHPSLNLLFYVQLSLILLLLLWWGQVGAHPKVLLL